jgi:UDP-GlcNAc:undecaprenyl-phosphate GlcNAc-1-phosphate transferase
MLNSLTLLKSFILPGAAAFLISYLATPASVAAARALGAIDMPDGGRKVNTLPTPRLGGLSFFLSFAISGLLFLPFGDKTVGAILLGGGVIVIFGVADDIRGLSPLVKLSAQVFAASLIVLVLGAPLSFSLFGLITIPLPLAFGIIFGIGRIAFTANAVNFSDGLDGLASGISAVACMAIALYAVKNGRTEQGSSAFILAMAILGFLPYNIYRARVFMGDSGSQFLGIAISALALSATPDGSFNLATALFLSVPVLDVWFSTARRIVKRKSPFAADRGHIHHFLLSLGLSHPAAVKILVSLSALVATVALFFV